MLHNQDNKKKYVPTDNEKRLCDWVYTKFKQSYVSKAPLMEQWKKYMKAYKGTLFNDESKPDYKSDEVSNMVFSVIETIRPIMVDNNPKFLAIPNNPEGLDFSSDVQMALDYEWEREKMPLKLPAQLIPMLVYGTAVWFIQWDGKKGEYGEISVKPIDPFNIFPDPLAESVEDAEYIIYATYKNANQLKQLFPKKASAIEGSRITMSELVAERDAKDNSEENQVLVVEMWCRDWVNMDKDVEGNDKLKYPKGRVITCLPELGILLDDKKNPYEDGRFPFVLMKNYDVPFEFWGVGDVEQILSPQKYINDLTNQIIDNAKSTANMQWIVDKNCGIGQGKLTNRPGLVIRKTPGSEVRRDAPPSMPSYVREQIDVLKHDMQDISGVFDSLKGEKTGSITAASAILALQEASQARIRLKIKIMESFLSDLATIVYSRMQQFWKLDRWVRVTDIEGNAMFKQIGTDVLKNNFDLKVMAGSTMPVNKNAMLDLMIRLAQTNAEDGMPIVDRRAILEFLPSGDRKAIIDRFENLKAQNEQAQQQQLQQQQMLQQEQQGQLDNNVTQQVVGMLQQVLQVNDMTSKQIDELILDKENRDKQEYESKIEEKGYKRGVKDGKMQIKKEEEKVTPGGEVVEESNNNIMDNGTGVPGDNVESIQGMGEEIEGQIPTEVLQELLTLAQEQPEVFREVLQNYPELAQMLQQDINGGMM